MCIFTAAQQRLPLPGREALRIQLQGSLKIQDSALMLPLQGVVVAYYTARLGCVGCESDRTDRGGEGKGREGVLSGGSGVDRMRCTE